MIYAFIVNQAEILANGKTDKAVFSQVTNFDLPSDLQSILGSKININHHSADYALLTVYINEREQIECAPGDIFMIDDNKVVSVIINPSAKLIELLK